MKIRGRILRGTVSGPVAVLILASSVVVPVVERADFSQGLIVESEHDPGSCPTPHDHTICAQFGANHSAPAVETDGASGPLIHRAAAPADANVFVPVAFVLTVSARAPPTA